MRRAGTLASVVGWLDRSVLARGALGTVPRGGSGFEVGGRLIGRFVVEATVAARRRER